MGWTVVVLTDEDVAKLLHYQLEARFERLFTTAAKVESAAMFRERRPERGVRHFYFSPGATEILAQDAETGAVFHPRECPAPFRDDVTFVAGDVSACFLLHGKENRR